MNKITKLMIIPFGLVAALLFTGCATIVRGTEETLVVQSEPSNADVKLSNGQCKKTPCSFKLKRKYPVAVTISKPGYESQCVNVNSEIAKGGVAGMAGNIVFGGIIGGGVDAVSGATNSLTPNPVCVKLDPAQS